MCALPWCNILTQARGFKPFNVDGNKDGSETVKCEV